MDEDVFARYPLYIRDTGAGADFNSTNWWWYSPVAYAVKWSIIAAIFILFMLFLLGGHIHAKRRMKKGLPLLKYHRWIVGTHRRAEYEGTRPSYLYPSTLAERTGRTERDEYAMHNYPPPPPAYNPDADHVPAYSPPDEASKAKSVQYYAEIPPPGPPPSRSNAESSSNGHEPTARLAVGDPSTDPQ